MRHIANLQDMSLIQEMIHNAVNKLLGWLMLEVI
uniref:Uncharacterized protein n=1 Tax=Klebsiella pneumoniae TaxID=573 RepID=W8EF52_KLEPN|nr:hypothetical protein [Klebsiella pneumoniae]